MRAISICNFVVKVELENSLIFASFSLVGQSARREPQFRASIIPDLFSMQCLAADRTHYFIVCC